MENSRNLKKELEKLNGRQFLFKGKPFTVANTGLLHGKYYIYTDGRTFVYYESDFRAFLGAITLIDATAPPPTEKTAAQMQNEIKITKLKNKIMDSESKTNEVTVVAADVAVKQTQTITDGLMRMFEILSGEPTEMDFKKADAMSKMAGSIVSVEQTKLNYMKLKNGR